MEMFKRLEELRKSRKTIVRVDGEKVHTWELTETQRRWFWFWILFGVASVVIPLLSSLFAYSYYLYRYHNDEIVRARTAEREQARIEENLKLPDTQNALARTRSELLTAQTELSVAKHELAAARSSIVELRTTLQATESTSASLRQELGQRAAEVVKLSSELSAATDRRKALIDRQAKSVCGELESDLRQALAESEKACAAQAQASREQAAQRTSEPPSLKAIPGEALAPLTFVQGDQWRRTDGGLLAVTKVDSEALHIRTSNQDKTIEVNNEEAYLMGFMRICYVRVLKVAPQASPPSALVEHWCPSR